MKDYIIGSNQRIQKVIDTIKQIAPFDATVLLTGESGVGKNRFADLIHLLSQRSQGPFVSINCGAIPENLLESELFGYDKGAFTGANASGKAGLIEVADTGTLFLDEIGDLPLQMQVKLLKVIQEKKITRVGGVREKKIDFRLIAASNRDIPRLVETGAFRKDLYYRLNVISIQIPALRERKEDIPEFLSYFMGKYDSKYGKCHAFSQRAVECLLAYSWPGNIRELENAIEGIVLTAEAEEVTEQMLPANIYSKSMLRNYLTDGKPLKKILEDVEKQVLAETYGKYKTTVKVAEVLGISQASASIKLNKYKIKED